MFREATTADLPALLDLERAANQAGLAHVFPPEVHPFPDADVLARWALVLGEPGVTVLVEDSDASGKGRSGLDLFAAYDDRSLRHLAVHPDRWGTGLATAGVSAALTGLRARGATEVELWCLVANRRARRLYEHLGWRPADDRRPAVWPPHPVEMRYTRSLADIGDRR